MIRIFIIQLLRKKIKWISQATINKYDPIGKIQLSDETMDRIDTEIVKVIPNIALWITWFYNSSCYHKDEFQWWYFVSCTAGIYFGNTFVGTADMKKLFSFEWLFLFDQVY